jgi:hypothetical protein
VPPERVQAALEGFNAFVPARTERQLVARGLTVIELAREELVAATEDPSKQAAGDVTAVGLHAARDYKKDAAISCFDDSIRAEAMSYDMPTFERRAPPGS